MRHFCYMCISLCTPFLIRLQKSNFSLYSRYYELVTRGAHPCSAATRLQRSIAAVANRWRHCILFDCPRNRTHDLLHRQRCLHLLRRPIVLIKFNRVKARLPMGDKNFSHLVCFILLFTDHAKTCEILLHLLTFLFSCIFILLSRESDQCAIRARLGVASHLSTTPRWGNPAKCLSQRHNK